MGELGKSKQNSDFPVPSGTPTTTNLSQPPVLLDLRIRAYHAYLKHVEAKENLLIVYGTCDYWGGTAKIKELFEWGDSNIFSPN